MSVDVRGGSYDRTAMISTLRRQHGELEDQLQVLTRSVHLTPSEQVEVRRLKRLKLQTKDRIHYLSRLGEG